MTKLRDRLNLKRRIEETYSDEEQQVVQQQEYQRPAPSNVDEEDIDTSPLAIIKEIKNDPSPKGAMKTLIGGIPVDLHSLEGYLVETSPFALKTVMRYHNARNMEEIKNYSRGPNIKMNSKTLILIMLSIGALMLGLVMIFFMPQIMSMFKGGM